MKISHLSTVHPSDDVRIFHKECRSLARAGFDVTLIARAEKDDVADGVRVRALSPRSKKRLVRMTRSVTDVLRMALDENAEVYHFHDPELIPAGLLLKIRGKRVVYDVHESVSKQIRTKYWIPAPLRGPVAASYRLFERAATRAFDGVVAATPGIANYFPARKTVVVQNFALQGEFATIDSSDYAGREPIVAYIGGITRARGILEMIEAMHLIGADARMVMGGSYAPESLEADMRTQPGNERIKHLGWLDRGGVREVLASARVGLLVLHPKPNYLDSYPVKLFEYMAAGLPVVASNFPFWKQFVSEVGCGLMVDPLDPAAIADAIQWLLENPAEAQAMGRRGREAALAHYTWESQAEKLVEFYCDRVLA